MNKNAINIHNIMTANVDKPGNINAIYFTIASILVSHSEKLTEIKNPNDVEKLTCAEKLVEKVSDHVVLNRTRLISITHQMLKAKYSVYTEHDRPNNVLGVIGWSHGEINQDFDIRELGINVRFLIYGE